nr:immunoglobulin light chain junction region [Macaca mulatta]MOW34579.1 immunoglobulin light chain junction region [Macaca mulatta]MOX07186.1 immunoglobulin light chain junction region [Macaca mulatta]MOX10038.1 immunoglobulin light chain junction region [Macaca mulatta]MOX10115.1 immunoglobulin light chain junction region [Macaca mulatta]
CLQYNTKPFTF